MAEAFPSGRAHARAIHFYGDWREYLPIAFTNFLLTVVTLGIYRFWATARERRYLWSRTTVIDDPLEWTGTGKEMFVGFVIAVLSANRSSSIKVIEGVPIVVPIVLVILWIGTFALDRTKP